MAKGSSHTKKEMDEDLFLDENNNPQKSRVASSKFSVPTNQLLTDTLQKLSLEGWRPSGVILTIEKGTMAVHDYGPDILKYQGRRYTPDDIAPVWKKDCRMWLWKRKSKTI